MMRHEGRKDSKQGSQHITRTLTRQLAHDVDGQRLGERVSRASSLGAQMTHGRGGVGAEQADTRTPATRVSSHTHTGHADATDPAGSVSSSIDTLLHSSHPAVHSWKSLPSVL